MKLGVHAPPAPEGGIAAVDALERELGRPVEIVSWYQHWDGWGPEPEPAWIAGAASRGRTPMLTWEPWRPDDGTEQPRFRLERIASGEFDDYAQRWADALRRTGILLYLRPMHEMNGTWYPWAGSVNGNSSADYRRAWRHLHDVFAQAGATNVRWVWSPNADDVPDGPSNAFESYYPGEEYVDVLAMDGYNWGTAEPGLGDWRSFATIFQGAYERLCGLGAQPIWVGETASDSRGGDKARWVREMFASATTMPRLAAIVWFHVDKERDWRATAPPGTASAFSCPRA